MSNTQKIILAVAIGIAILIAVKYYFSKKTAEKEKAIEPDFYIDASGRKMPKDINQYVTLEIWLAHKVAKGTIDYYNTGGYNTWINDIMQKENKTKIQALEDIIRSNIKTSAKNGEFYKASDSDKLSFATDKNVGLLPLKS
jgi:hypothetical protein